MSKQRSLRIVTTAALTCVILSHGCQRVVPIKRPAKGKTLQQWAEIAAAPLQPSNFVDVHHRYAAAKQKRREALEQIRLFDAAAIPVLMKLSQNPERDLSSDANRILSRIGKQISPEAESVIPLMVSLRDHATDSSVRQWTETVLKDIGSGTPAVSAMMKPLSDRSLRSAVVVEIASSDWWINEMSSSTKPMAALQHIASPSGPKISPDTTYADVATLHEQVSGTRAYVIDNYETKRLPPVAELIEQAENLQTRMIALQGLLHYAHAGAAVPGIDLGSLTPDLSAAIPVLIEIGESGNRRNATRAIKILGLIGKAARSAVPLALQMLGSDFYDASAEAAAALGGFGVTDRTIVQALVDSCENDKSTDDRFGRSRGQGSGRGPGSGKGRSMRSYLPEGTLRANVAVSLGRLAAHPDLSVPLLVKMLDLSYGHGSKGCDAAAESLGAFGHDAQIAVPQLVDNLRGRPYTQPTLTALRRIDPGLDETIAVLVAKLRSDNDGIRRHAILVLALLRVEAAPAIPALVGLAQSSDATIAFWAAYTLWKIAPDTHSLIPALPLLIQALEDPKTGHFNKNSVLSDLATLGPQAKPAVPAIIKAIRRGDFGKAGGLVYLEKIDPIAAAELTTSP